MRVHDRVRTRSEAREALELRLGLGFTDVAAERSHCHHALDALQLLLHKLAVEESLHVLLGAELLVEACIAAQAEDLRHQPAPLGRRALWAVGLPNGKSNFASDAFP